MLVLVYVIGFNYMYEGLWVFGEFLQSLRVISNWFPSGIEVSLNWFPC